MAIDTDKFSESLRDKMIDKSSRRLLITRLGGSDQEVDMSEPANCGGYGRIRHFRRAVSPGWPQNPLPIDPAAFRLGLPKPEMIRAQVFQNAGCNWRCWYCFVPFPLLNADQTKSVWLSVGEMIDLYEKENDRPAVIDLTGGQPDLTPEWVPWMMFELKRRGLSERTYLWSDDNLSTDYFWRYLSETEIRTVQEYVNYGKVCCFKGFDAESFAFNTKAAPSVFDRQFELFRRYHSLRLDLYAYATFTSPQSHDVPAKMSRFVSRLQEIHSHLPLRVIPLEIRTFSPVSERMSDEHEVALKMQAEAIACWNHELEQRFSPDERALPIYAVPI